MAWWTGKPCATDTCIQATYYNAILDKGELAWDCVYGTGGGPFASISRATADVTEICADDVNTIRGHIETMTTSCGDCGWATLGQPCEDSTDILSGDPVCICDFDCLDAALDCILDNCCEEPGTRCSYLFETNFDCNTGLWEEVTTLKDCYESTIDCDTAPGLNEWYLSYDDGDTCYYAYETCITYLCDVDDDCPDPEAVPDRPEAPFDCSCAGIWCTYYYQGHWECPDGSSSGAWAAIKCVYTTCVNDSDCDSPPDPPPDPDPSEYTCSGGGTPTWVYDGLGGPACDNACEELDWTPFE